MTFSIVIPTYNGAKFVAEAIESALAQTRPADEIIVSDDNSSDNTLDICQKFGNKIKVFRNPDGPSGFVNGWNHAISHATSDYISILHQDDLLAPSFLEEVEAAIKKNPDVKHIVTGCNYIDGKGAFLSSSPFTDGNTYRFSGQEYVHRYVFTPGGHIHRCPGVVTHKDIFKQCQYREEAGHIADDDFFFRVGNYTDIIGIAKPLASYREHKGSETGHLASLELIKRLQVSHIFQVKHSIENPLFDHKMIKRYRHDSYMYSRWLVFFGLKAFQATYVWQGLKGFFQI